MVEVTRHQTLRHIHRISRDGDIGAKCPFGEMIDEAERATKEGLVVWRDDVPFPGRFLTEEGKAALAEMEAAAAAADGDRPPSP